MIYLTPRLSLSLPLRWLGRKLQMPALIPSRYLRESLVSVVFNPNCLKINGKKEVVMSLLLYSYSLSFSMNKMDVFGWVILFCALFGCLVLVGCLVGSVTFTYWMPVALPSPKLWHLQMLPHFPWKRANLSLIENHWGSPLRRRRQFTLRTKICVDLSVPRVK